MSLGSLGSSLPYMRQLDGLRAVAVFAVLIHHFLGPKNLLNRFFPWGAIGVRLFFVLSGFLITGILIAARERREHGDASPSRLLRDFYARRFLRIGPAYYLALAAAALFGIVAVLEHPWWYVAYASNIQMALSKEWSGSVSHFWSLAVEEQFYLVWPWLVLFLPRRALLPVLGGLVVLAPCFRAGVLGALGRDGYGWASMFPLACADSLGIGAVLALVTSQPLRRNALIDWGRRIGIPLAATLFLVRLVFGDEVLPHLEKLVAVDRVFLHTVRGVTFILQGLALSFLFVWLVGRAADGFGGRAAAFLGAAPVVALGRISYGVYLVHNFVPHLMATRVRVRSLGLGGTSADAVAFLANLVVTLVIASASWLWFERPLNGLKRYFDYGEARPG